MATLDFSRSVEQDLKTKKDRLFDAVLDISRDDSGSVDFSSKSILMDVLENVEDETPLVTLSSGTEITISTAQLTFSKIFTELEKRSYAYRLYNNTDKIGIAHGRLIVI